MDHKTCEYLKKRGDEDIANGDYVTLSRTFLPYPCEQILTFSGILITKNRVTKLGVTNASYAKARESEENSEESA